ncbi:MAG: hypothetical protein GY810_09455 [Aureispira sp.]|nr:hypothetical protein [Aureispira sp.]
MKNSRLIELFKSFSSKEKRLLGLWLDSPIHNSRKDVKKLYLFLIEDTKGLQVRFLHKELTWAMLYPKQDYDDGQLRQTIHQLLKAVEQFLAYQEFQQDATAVQLSLIKNLRKRKTAKAFQVTSKQLEQKLKKQTQQDATYVQHQHNLLMEQFLVSEEAMRIVPRNLQKVSDSLDIQYIAQKLRQACLLHPHQAMYKNDYNPKLLDVILAATESEGYQDSIPAIGVYYHCYLALRASPEAAKHYDQLLIYLYTQSAYFGKDEMRSLYLLAINYTIRQLNEGIEGYLEKVFELYRTGIEEGFLVQDGNLSPWTYRNAITAGIRLQKYAWAEKFIKTYQSFIPIAHQDTIPKECLAKLYYEQKQYKKAITILDGIQFKDILLQINSKIILAKIYYELQDLDALDPLLHNIKTYLKRKELVGYHKENYNNVIRLIQRLVKTNLFDKEAKKALREEIQNTQPLTEKDWLLQELQ